MAKTVKLPMGIEDFEEMCTLGYYYVDKTGLIKDLLDNLGKVNLFTRPRRFGKTLNMSMLKCFFETGCERALFDGLEISNDKEICDNYMGKFPVVSISLKDVVGDSFEEAKGMLRWVIVREALRFQFLMQSDRLTEIERRQYDTIIAMNEKGIFTMDDENLKNSLQVLSQLLRKHYGQSVIILIDEYDVPLDKAYRSGYYDAMVGLIRSLFRQALKSNQSLSFAVLTGCLRVSKESIFTGLNNFNVYTISDVKYNEYYGFTDADVRKMLAYYGFMEQYDVVKEWYDGYQFGNLEVYCQWDVINYCGSLRGGNGPEPRNYWINTSSNDIIRSFVNKANSMTKREIEALIEGGSIKKKIRQELTYRDLDSDIEHLWSILFTTGYLTQRGIQSGNIAELVIPNREIRWIFVEQIQEWFREETKKDRNRLDDFCRAFQENDVAAIQEGFTAYLGKMISIRDTNSRKSMKENFYHGVLLGIFGHMDDWIILSEAESGDGYCDILVEIEQQRIGFVIELKYAENADFDAGCKKAMKQIRDENYEEALVRDGMETIYRYGIACYQKRCKVVSE